MESRKPLIGLTLEQLRHVAADEGLPRFAAGQIAKWLYDKRVTDIAEMTDLSKSARARLAEKYTVGREAPKAEARSTDGTVKYCLKAPEAATSRLSISPTASAQRCASRRRPVAR